MSVHDRVLTAGAQLNIVTINIISKGFLQGGCLVANL